jgi:3-hydroxymyristoyl/3-hydroxydecanoyl-(acyl carrier protein) dehydratase
VGELHAHERAGGGERNTLRAAADAAIQAALRSRVARVHAALPPPRPGSFLVFAFDDDRAAFLAALLGSWSKGHGVALPANPRRGSVAPVLALPASAMLLHDSGIGMGLDVRRLLASSSATNEPELADVPLAGALTTHAQDERGRLCSRSWSATSLSALVDETLARLRLPAGATVWNAFRPACPHALVPGWLAPLRAGCRLAGGTGLDTAALALELERRCVHTLVAPAALLRALASRPRREIEKLQVVTADAPLDARSLGRFAAAGTRVVELPACTWASAPGQEVRLLQAVLELDGVADAAVAAADHGELQFFCAVQAPSRSADELLRALPAPFRGNTTLRCVDQLGRDEDGQVGRDLLLRLFGRASNGEVLCAQLQLTAIAVSRAEARFRTQVPADFFAFEGHFQGYPVLSGAVQLHELVLPCLEAALGPRCEATAFLDMKFLARIAPGDFVDVTLSWGEQRTHAEFEIARDGVRCSAGRVVLRNTPEAAP